MHASTDQLMIGLAGSSGALGIISLLIVIWLLYYLITNRKRAFNQSQTLCDYTITALSLSICARMF